MPWAMVHITAGSVVCQFALFPSSNSLWCHSQFALLTACSNFIMIYPNLFDFILILFQFWKERCGID